MLSADLRDLAGELGIDSFGYPGNSGTTVFHCFDSALPRLTAASNLPGNGNRRLFLIDEAADARDAE